MRYYITISGIEKFKELVKCWKLFHSNIWIGQKKNLNTKVFALSNQNSDATIRRCSTKFRNIHRKKPVLESFFWKKLQSFHRATPGNCFWKLIRECRKAKLPRNGLSLSEKLVAPYLFHFSRYFDITRLTEL